jgi:hypothetical protein
MYQAIISWTGKNRLVRRKIPSVFPGYRHLRRYSGKKCQGIDSTCQKKTTLCLHGQMILEWYLFHSILFCGVITGSPLYSRIFMQETPDPAGFTFQPYFNRTSYTLFPEYIKKSQIMAIFRIWG